MVFWQSHLDHVRLAAAHDFLLHVVQTIQAGKQAWSNYARALQLRFINAMSEVWGTTQLFFYLFAASRKQSCAFADLVYLHVLF